MNAALMTKINVLLKAAAGVMAICEDRSYTGEAPQGASPKLPYNVLTSVDSTPEETLDDNATMDSAFLQITAYGKTPIIAADLRTAIRAAIAADGAIAGGVVHRPTDRGLQKEEAIDAWSAVFDFIVMYDPTAA